MTTARQAGSAIFSAVSGIFSRPEGVSYLQNIIATTVRTKFTETDYTKPVDAPTGVKLYEDLAKKKGFESKVVPLETGGTAVWYGSSTAKSVLFYIPGGGYVWPPVEGHVLFLNDFQRAITEKGKDFAIFCFNYDLAPTAKHPVQLKQTVAALNYLLKTTNLNPKDIIVGGDSAGGNLTLMLLSHAVHKFPGVDSINLDGQSLGGTILLCPWVNMIPEGPNIERNKTICYISHDFLGNAGKVWLSESKDDEFTSPIRNDPSWWKDVPSGDILVTGGEYEYFVDDIDAFVEKLKVHKKVEYVRGKQEIHDQFAVCAMLGAPTCQTDEAARSFVNAKL